MNKRIPIRSHEQGMSLVEMMIAMTISLIVIGAVSGVYLSTSRNYTQDEMLSRMQENARYALHVLSKDLSMSGYWGPLISGQNINTTGRSCPETDGDGNLENHCSRLFTGSTLTVGTDCGPGTGATAPPIWAYSLDKPIEVMTEVDPASNAAASFGCIDASEFQTGSDVLVVKRVEGEEIPSSPDHGNDVGDIFLRTDGADAMLFNYATDLSASEGADISDWRYRSNVYYIRDHFVKDGDGNPADEIPTLVRERLDGNSLQTEGGGVAQGIEYFHVMFGIDDEADADATANYYTSDPSPDDLENVTSARIYVLARSANEDPNYVNDKVYQLGDVTRDFSAAADQDNFYRRVFTTTVTLRNQRNRIATTGN